MDEDLDEFIPTRQSLLSRLKNWDDSPSWREFFNTYWKLIYAVARRAGLTETEAEEVVQETMLGVARSIGQFRYDPARSSFKNWLLQVTRHRIAQQCERRRRQPPAEPAPEETSRTPLLQRLADPAGDALKAIWDAEWEKNLVDAALRKVKNRAPIRQYQIFDFFVLKKWPAAKVARTLGVSIGHVYVAKHRITRLVRKEIELLSKKPL